MKSKRDRRQTLRSTSLASGKSIEDFWADAIPLEGMGPKAISNDTASAFYLNGEGTSEKKENEKEEEKSKDLSQSGPESGNKDKHNEIISKSNYSSRQNPKNTVSVFGPDKKRLKNTRISKAKKWIKQKKARQVKDKSRLGEFAIQLLNKPVGKIRVPVVDKDGKPLMPTLSGRARRWIEKGKAVGKRTKTGIFYVQLLVEPSGRNKQDIVATLDPGSRYTGVAVCSKKQVLYGCNLELIADEKENRFASIKNRMDKRRELRRGRRYRNCRRREARFDNRSKTGKMAPSIRARKQLELKVISELCEIFPISVIGIEDVAFNHYTKRWGKNFSQVEVGKKWLYEELKKIPGIREVRLIKGYDTNIRRQQLGLEKGAKKEEREVRAHVNDCIAMGSIILGIGIETKTRLRLGINFDIITRPKYSRRKLHDEKASKGGIRKRHGGTTIDWTNIRLGDYVEAARTEKGIGKMIYRGWAGGFSSGKNDNNSISLYDFDWKRIGQFGVNNVRLLNRRTGLMVKSMEISENIDNICKYGTEQVRIEDAWK